MTSEYDRQCTELRRWQEKQHYRLVSDGTVATLRSAIGAGLATNVGWKPVEPGTLYIPTVLEGDGPYGHVVCLAAIPGGAASAIGNMNAKDISFQCVGTMTDLVGELQPYIRYERKDELRAAAIRVCRVVGELQLMALYQPLALTSNCLSIDKETVGNEQ